MTSKQITYKMNNLRKMGGVAVLLATTLAIADSALAINLSIGNSSNNITFGGDDIGQSFINDPTGTGASILLNDWTFAVIDLDFTSVPFNPVPVIGRELRVFTGNGNSGTQIGSSLTSTVTTLAGRTATRWTFAGGLTLIDNQTYTAVLVGGTSFPGGILVFDASDVNPYANGFTTSGSNPFSADFDTVFSANFSSAAAPVPFDFEPSAGLAVIGGLWLGRKYLKNRQNKLKE
jgi:hypothetical protein